MFDDDLGLILDADGDGDCDFFDREEAEEDLLLTESEENAAFDYGNEDEEIDADA